MAGATSNETYSKTFLEIFYAVEYTVNTLEGATCSFLHVHCFVLPVCEWIVTYLKN